MRHLLFLTFFALSSLSLATPQPAAADEDLPPGLQSARLLPGWTDDEGRRVSALELVLEPGWKTYWRSPGDAGLPPHFEWRGSNIGTVELQWPAPEVFMSNGLRTLGYHDRLVLPFTVTPAESGKPVGLSADVTLGICDDICVPAMLDLAAAPAENAPDPVIVEAMGLVPHLSEMQPACEIGEIEDGMTVTLSLPVSALQGELVIEHGTDPRIWVSAPELSADRHEVTADFVAPSGKPFPLDPEAIVMTVVDQASATEFRGCTTG